MTTASRYVRGNAQTRVVHPKEDEMAMVFSGPIPPEASLEDVLRAARREAKRALDEVDERPVIGSAEELRRGVAILDAMIQVAHRRTDDAQ